MCVYESWKLINLMKCYTTRIIPGKTVHHAQQVIYINYRIKKACKQKVMKGRLQSLKEWQHIGPNGFNN